MDNDAKIKISLIGPEMSGWHEGQDCKGNIIIFPGGGYEHLSVREGKPVAGKFAAAGWKPWILHYPICSEGGISPPLGLLPMTHAAEAVKRVRSLNPSLPVVVCGFSAGAHVAASLGVHWEDENVFPLEEQRFIRPDAMILCYPVITAGRFAHRGSIDNLTLGAGNIGDLTAYFSLENYISSKTPPAFLWHTAADAIVPVQNSLLFAEGLASAGVPFELHIYPYGEHGLSLATPEVQDNIKHFHSYPHVAGWLDECIEWLDI